MLLSKYVIRDSILSGTKITCAEQYLDENDLPINFKTDGPNNLPPFLHARFEIEPDDSPDAKYINGLEKLSLAQRAKILSIKEFNHLQNSEKPYWFKKAKEADGITISGSDLSLAIKLASQGTPKNDGSIPVLKLIGVSIKGDVDISRVNVPFSLRLIGCTLNGSLLLDRTELDTLDLTGSVITRGISANYMKTRGAVRLRRVLSLAPFDFGGAQISATLDATDMILMPVNRQSSSISFVGDRAMLNLSLATIDKDTRLIRSRIYGGVNMRGASIGGSLFLSDLIVRSPLATLELLAIQNLQGLGDPNESNSVASNVTEYASYDIARILHEAPDNQSDRFTEENGYQAANYERAVETLSGVDIFNIEEENHAYSLLNRLLFESSTCRECSIRAEKIKVKGSVIATRLRSSGLLRMRDAKIGGRVDMKGVRFRNTVSVFSVLKELVPDKNQQCSATGNRNKPASINEIIHRATSLDMGDDNPVLDFEDAVIGGSLDLGKCHVRKCGEFVHPIKQNDQENGLPSTVTKKIYHYGDNHLIENIANRLIESRDDPIEFYHLFYPGHKQPATLYEKRLDQAPNEHSSSSDWLEYQLKELGRRHDMLYHDEFLEARQNYLEHIQNRKTSALTELSEKEAKDEATAFRAFAQVDRDPPQIRDETVDEETQRRIVPGVVDVPTTLGSFGELRSSLVLGRISLNNVRIKGHVIMRGLIANMFDRKQTADDQTHIALISVCSFLGIFFDIKKLIKALGGKLGTSCASQDKKGVLPNEKIARFIEGKNARIGGDLDLRESAGITGANFDHARIGGSVKFFTKAKYCVNSDIYLPIEGRALLGSYNGRADREVDDNPVYNYGCVLRFKNAVIEGNAQLLFDTHSGPSLKLFNAAIGGNLTIAPTFGAFEVSAKEHKKRVECAAKIRRLGEVSPWRRIVNLFSKHPDKIDSLHARVRSNYRQARPAIDLRNASVTVFGHSVRAWPVQDCLRINGFKYARTRSIGPLVPLRRSWKEVDDDRKRNRIPYLIAILGIFLYAAFVIILREIAWLEQFGKFNVTVLLVLLGYWALKTGLSQYTGPKVAQSEPLARDWLQLQRRQLNTQKSTSGVVPLEPYIRAASVLRAAGRTRSANLIELDRLIARRRALSLRYQALLSLMLFAAEASMKYGFKPMRAILFLLSVVLIGAAGVNYGSLHGQVVPTDRHRLILAGHDGSEIDTTILSAACEDDKFPCDVTKYVQQNYKTYPQFISTLYAIDIVVPFFDLNQDKYWTVLLPNDKDKEEDCTACPPLEEVGGTNDQNVEQTSSEDKDWLGKIIWGTILFIELLGWFFTTIIAISVASRIETIHARNEEM